MKALVAVACIAVIALAIYVVGGGIWSEKIRADDAKESAFLAQCDDLIAKSEAEKAAMSGGEKARAIQLSKDCLAYIRGK